MIVRPRCYSVTNHFSDGQPGSSFCLCWGTHADPIEEKLIEMASVYGHARLETPIRSITVSRPQVGQRCEAKLWDSLPFRFPEPDGY